MRKVKYIDGYNQRLTKGKVYDVIITEGKRISIINDIDIEKYYLMVNNITGKIMFEDVTHEYRNDVIDEILN